MKWLSRLLDKDNDLKEHSYDAKDWASCTVGEFRDQFPQVILYNDALNPPRPKDSRLLTLGVKFFHAVRAGQRTSAINLYRQIERRVITLAKRG